VESGVGGRGHCIVVWDGWEFVKFLKKIKLNFSLIFFYIYWLSYPHDAAGVKDCKVFFVRMNSGILTPIKILNIL